MRSSYDSSNGLANLSRRVSAGRLAWPILFSVTEIWAVVVVLTQIRVDGVDAAALALLVAGVVLAIWSEWRESRELVCRSHPSHCSTPPACASKPKATSR
jgi:hypothetical protein